MEDSEQRKVNEEPVVLCEVKRHVNSGVHRDVSLLPIQVLAASIDTIERVVPLGLLIVCPLRVVEVCLRLGLEIVTFREAVLVCRLLQVLSFVKLILDVISLPSDGIR